MENTMKYALFIFPLLLLLMALDLHAQNTRVVKECHAVRNLSDIILKSNASGTSGIMRTDTPPTPVYLPDTLILYTLGDTMRITAAYDSHGNNTRQLVQVLYAGFWVNYDLTTWTYSGPNGNSVEIEKSWSGGQWNNLTLDSSSFDAQGHMLVHLFRYWDQGMWKDSILSNRAYDANGNMLTDIGWHWRGTQWVYYNRITRTYDNGGHMLSSLSEIYASGQWMNWRQDVYTYDQDGHMLTYLSRSWDNIWYDETLSTYTYDANGNMLTYLLQNMASGQMTNYTIHEYTYNPNGKMLTDLLKGWMNGSWVNGSFITNTYDASGNMTTRVLQYWFNGSWTNDKRTTYSYDTHGNIRTGDNTQWTGSAWAPANYTFTIPIAGSGYDFTGYHITLHWLLYNTSDVADIRNALAGQFALEQNYPNPFNPSTTVRYSLSRDQEIRLAIYDILGREVAVLVNGREAAGSRTVRFDAHALASGVYYCSLRAGGASITRRMLLIK
jgi:hypothetical protein